MHMLNLEFANICEYTVFFPSESAMPRNHIKLAVGHFRLHVEVASGDIATFDIGYVLRAEYVLIHTLTSIECSFT